MREGEKGEQTVNRLRERERWGGEGVGARV